MTKDNITDRAIDLIAEGIMEASDEEIKATALEHGIDVDRLLARVREIVSARTAQHLPHSRGFAVGDTVALRSDPSRLGVVTAVTKSNRETRVGVFVGGRLQTLYASQLMPADIGPGVVRSNLNEFNARLTALQLVEPSIANLYSLQAGRVDFIPYQFRPVIKFIGADRPRMLLADEVGVGKTIEAGLLLRELQARRPLRSVMIVCSKSLVVEEKWHREMRRFDEEFTTLGSDELKYSLEQTDLDGEWPERHSRGIIPFSLINDNFIQGFVRRDGSRGPGLSTLDAPPRFDLLIVDEAHNARNSETNLHQGLRILADNAEAVVLITATPVQLGSDDLFSLLNLLRPDLVIDRPTFQRMAEPNQAVNAAIAQIRAGGPEWQDAARSHLIQAASTSWGRVMLAKAPEFTTFLVDLDQASGDEDRVRLIQPAERFHSFSSMISRTRRRDIGNFTTRKAWTIEVSFTDRQAEVHDALLAVQRAIYLRAHGAAPLGFLMTTIRRQAASCLPGLVPLLDEILSRRLSDVERAEIGDLDDEAATVDLGTLSEEIRNVLSSAKDLPAEDPKFDRLVSIVGQKAEMENRRLIVFSSFRHTLAYLERRLAERGLRVGLIHGGIDDDERRLLRRAFALPSDDPRAIDVLLSSEVGSEGLDFQFCDAIVNYDIPWNPMRIEQRIGRIDRYGQASQTVAIYNFVTPGTVDFDIYQRCLLRIGVFERSIGGSEAILGEIARQIQDVADDFALNLDERNARLQQLADNEIRQVLESDALEEREAELFGVRVARTRIDDDIARASSVWLEPRALERLINVHLEKELGFGRTPISGQGTVKSLRLSSDSRRSLLQRPKGTRPSLAEREWESWLRGDQQTLALTFDQEAANADRSLAFVTPVHPLTQNAARSMAQEEELLVTLRVDAPDLPPGEHPFAIYQWQLLGLREDAVLVPVVEHPDVAEAFMGVFESAFDDESVPPPPTAMLDGLDGWHHDLWVTRRAKHVQETAEIARFRRDSLQASHAARLAVIKEQLAGAREERIKRMRAGQLARALADQDEALRSLAAAENRADIIARRVAVGILRVERRS